MISQSSDDRRPAGKQADERIAAESPLPPLDLPADAVPSPVEGYLAKCSRRPVALAGVVENGLIRPLDPDVHFAERTRVIIVAMART